MSKPADTKLARHLQKRGTWDSYSSCLREVRRYLTMPGETHSFIELKRMIDEGKLDPLKSSLE